MFMKITINFLTLLMLFAASNANAIQILKTKENKVLIDLEGETASTDQFLYMLNEAGKKIGLAKIIQIKGERAIAVVTKGTARGTSSAALLEMKKEDDDSEKSPSKKTRSEQPIYRPNAWKISSVLSYSMNNMKTKRSDGTLPTPNQEDVMLTGSSFGVAGILDYPFNKSFILRGTVGYEPYVGSGTAQFLSCGSLNTTSCDVNIQYLSAGGYVRYNLTNPANQFWMGLGVTGKYPIGKSSSALKTDDIQATMTYAIGFGMDYYLDASRFLPFSLDYQIFLNSDTVSANLIMLRGGYGWVF